MSLGREPGPGKSCLAAMLSPANAPDYDALVATTNVEDMTEDEDNRYILQLMMDDDGDFSGLCLCSESNAMDDYDEYHPKSSEELGWVGHFAKKSTHLEEFGLSGSDDEIFSNCSKQSVDRFIDDIGKCNHIKKLKFNYRNDLPALFRKMGPVMTNSNIKHYHVGDCDLGAEQLYFLFSVFRDIKSLEALTFAYSNDYDHDSSANYGHVLDASDIIKAGCIKLLAACVGLHTLNLYGLSLSTHSCTELGAIFPRMASLQFLNLNENLIGGGVDDTVETLVRGLVECKHLHTLFMQNNYITDSGLEMLIRGLPTSVSSLYLHGNQIALARQLPLLRFKELELSDNPLSPGAPQVVAASLVNPECRLIGMEIYDTNIGDEGATILAESLRSNRRVVKMRLALYSSNNTNITEAGWNAFLPSLYNTASINDTHGSNHTLRNVGFIPRNISQGVQTMLNLNSDQNKSRVAATKILQAHRHLDMKPILSRRLDLLPYVAMWLERFAESQLDLKLTLIFDFVRAMPMDVVHGVVGKKKGKKRYRNGT
mmetsp:Transcript_22501/g.53080  ORF Transcript_22501/g.53080 Transcript_22501/m.53080 type:complete len:541 (+) Transcript_22501:195-1817(+)